MTIIQDLYCHHIMITNTTHALPHTLLGMSFPPYFIIISHISFCSLGKRFKDCTALALLTLMSEYCFTSLAVLYGKNAKRKSPIEALIDNIIEYL